MAKKDVKEITKQLEEGVKSIFESDRYKEYLTFMGKFHNYSVNNIILILMQKPDASLVAGYKAWQTKFKRQVRKGEKAITIIAPCPHKRVTEDEDGTVIEEVYWTTFTTTSVFDISQTDGEDIPNYITTLTDDVENYDELLQKLEKASPVKVEFEDIEGSANGYFNFVENRIAIQEGMSQLQTIKTLVHEISHAMLHGKDGEEHGADRDTREVQAESVAYTVCSMLGLDTSDYSFGYVAGWGSGKDIKELTASMEVIRKTANIIFEAVA